MIIIASTLLPKAGKSFTTRIDHHRRNQFDGDCIFSQHLFFKYKNRFFCFLIIILLEQFFH